MWWRGRRPTARGGRRGGTDGALAAHTGQSEPAGVPPQADGSHTSTIRPLGHLRTADVPAAATRPRARTSPGRGGTVRNRSPTPSIRNESSRWHRPGRPSQAPAQQQPGEHSDCAAVLCTTPGSTPATHTVRHAHTRAASRPHRRHCGRLLQERTGAGTAGQGRLPFGPSPYLHLSRKRL